MPQVVVLLLLLLVLVQGQLRNISSVAVRDTMVLRSVFLHMSVRSPASIILNACEIFLVDERLERKFRSIVPVSVQLYILLDCMYIVFSVVSYMLN